MGLDMYLTKEIYVGGNSLHREVSGEINYKIKGKQINIPIERVEYIVLEMGYWSKANHIHRWFVENIQDGIDECQKTYVSKEDLIELKSVCQKVLENPNKLAEELLPTQSGFFFGSTDYDKFYFEDIRKTIEIIDNCLSDNLEGEYYYQSSW